MLTGWGGTEAAASAETAEAVPAAARLRAAVAAQRDRLEAPSIFRFFNHGKGDDCGNARARGAARGGDDEAARVLEGALGFWSEGEREAYKWRAPCGARRWEEGGSLATWGPAPGSGCQLGCSSAGGNDNWTGC